MSREIGLQKVVSGGTDDFHVPVYRVVNSGRPTIHRFFDTSPISPSGRYIGLTEFPFEDRLPSPGDMARVVVIDLSNGSEVYAAETGAWDTQVGAHVQWGVSDHELFFNRMDVSTWEPYGVKVDPLSGEERRLEASVYVVSPDGRYALTPCLRRISRVQAGYGVHVPEGCRPINFGAPLDDGITVIDIETGAARLLLSLAEIYRAFAERMPGIDLSRGKFYSFHVKYNQQGDRIMFILRWLPQGEAGRSQNYLITLRPDGSDLAMAVDARQWGGGHHPNWCPDGEHIVMNQLLRNPKVPFARLVSLGERILRKIGVRVFSTAYQMRFAVFRYDGSNWRVVAPSHFGSGHPTIHAASRYLMTDAYPYERVAVGDGTVPLRMIDTLTDRAETVVRIKTEPVFNGPAKEYRVDPHPAWDRTGRWLVFNASPRGVREVFLADMEGYLERA